MRVIGLCGRSGSGKGVFSELAREKGMTVIDCDAVYREMVSNPSDCLREIESEFGSEVIKNSALDRRALSKIVFSDREKLNRLNEITHKYVLTEVERIIGLSPDDSTVIIDAPTMFESGCDKYCDLIIGIIAPDDVCVSRIVARDGILESDAISRLSNQYSNEFIVENSDVIIYNDSDINEYKQTISDFLENEIM
jgi:dephospho-CoA kinase